MKKALPRFNPYRPLPIDPESLERARKCVAEARAALALPRPSVFLGNPTPKKIPLPRQEEDAP